MWPLFEFVAGLIEPPESKTPFERPPPRGLQQPAPAGFMIAFSARRALQVYTQP